ncbi:IS66 family insertion sequence element accessory protein TnpB, partial [Psychromonas antarctica]
DDAQFKWPLKDKKEVLSINGQQLNWLLDGIDIFSMKPHKTLHYSTVL